VAATRVLSPRLLIDLAASAGAQVAEYFASLDPYGEAVFPVAWAGETNSRNWFDIAREFAEQWHHQQQIRDAVYAPPLMDRRYLHPVLDTCVRALPYSYRHTDAPQGTTVSVTITGAAGDAWHLTREADRWTLHRGESPVSTAALTLDQNTAWRLIATGLEGLTAGFRCRMQGDRALAEVALNIGAIMS
jgi:hypothetical protein